MDEQIFLIPCLMGLEKLVADELKRLGMGDVRAENGRVFCRGGLEDIPRLNLWLRCGARVLLVLGEFPARSFEALFQGVYALPWEELIPRDGEFPVKGYSISSQLHSVPACQSIVKKAVSRRLSERYGLEWLPETGHRFQIQFSILKDQAVLALDTSGEGLYKRGYRAVGVEAPLRETLAAAAVPLQGAGPLPGPLLRQRHHPHRGRPDRQEPGPGAEPLLCRPEVAGHPRRRLDGRGGGGHGRGVPRQLRHLGRGHRPPRGGDRPRQRRESGGGGRGAL